MVAWFTIKSVRGHILHNLPKRGCFTVRGYKRGKKAKPGKCVACGDEIAIGEQYIRIDEAYSYCLGCVDYD